MTPSGSPRRRPPLRVLLASVGSRGDVEPFVLLADALASRGHHVVLSLDRGFDSSPVHPGVSCTPLGMLGRPALSAIVTDAVSRRTPRARSAAACESYVGRRQGALFVHLSSLLDHRGFDVVVVPPALFFTRGDKIAWSAPTVVVRYSSVTGHLARSARDGACLQLAALPRELFVKAGRRERSCAYTGFWWRSAAGRCSAEVRRFLGEGAPPFFLTMGSMCGFDARALARAFVAASRRCGRRAILQRGWARLAWPPTEDVLVVDEVDYAAILPRCEAVFVHGGTGTVTSALRAGRPIGLLPLVADQRRWVRRLKCLGVGLGAIDPLRAEAGDLERLMRRALTDARYSTAATALAGRLQESNGLERACLLVERFAARRARR
jgi:UDP:flavonoid glycosyltransferase YjiC (YdhE family)